MPRKYAKRKKRVVVKRRQKKPAVAVVTVGNASTNVQVPVAPAALHALRWYQAPGEPLPVLQQYVAGEWKAVPLTTVW